jgi:hypothetical protein
VLFYLGGSRAKALRNPEQGHLFLSTGKFELMVKSLELLNPLD